MLLILQCLKPRIDAGWPMTSCPNRKYFFSRRGDLDNTSNVLKFCRFLIGLKVKFIALPNPKLNYVTFENGD